MLLPNIDLVKTLYQSFPNLFFVVLLSVVASPAFLFLRN
jgi:hypothetical protein